MGTNSCGALCGRHRGASDGDDFEAFNDLYLRRVVKVSVMDERVIIEWNMMLHSNTNSVSY